MAIPSGFNPPSNIDTDPLVELVLPEGPNIPTGVPINIGGVVTCIAGQPFMLRNAEAHRLVAGVAGLEFTSPPPAVVAEPVKKVLRRKG